MANARKKRRPAPGPKPERIPAPEVVYTQPEPIDRKRFILRLLTVAAVVLALFVGFSIFFRVDTVIVSGNRKYTAWTIQKAAGIDEGDSLLSFGKAKACGKIKEALPYVKTVRVGIKLPGTVNIFVDEVEVVYSVQAQNGAWWLMTSEGRLVEKTSAAEAAKHTKILGVELLEPKAGNNAQAAEPDPKATDEEGQEPVITVTNAERLQTALEILVRLEHNEILGEAASVDVTDMGNIELWYGSRYQVLLGEPGRIDEKVDMFKQTLGQMGSHQSGVLDITLQVQTDGVVYKPFD